MSAVARGTWTRALPSDTTVRTRWQRRVRSGGSSGTGRTEKVFARQLTTNRPILELFSW